MNITIYTKKKCPYCKYAKEWLKNYNLQYKEIPLDDDKERDFFYKEHIVNTVPQIFIDNIRIGGYNDLIQRHDIAFNNSRSTTPSKTYKPFSFDWAYEIRTTHENDMHWHEGEADLSEDILDWKTNKVSENEKDFIVNILRLFTQSDVAVGGIYFDKFIPKFKNNEIRNMLSSFATREAIHQAAYALFNDTLGLPDEEYHTFLDYAEMTDKLDFMIDSDPNTVEGLALALAKSVFNEGVTLFASFVMLLNFQRFGKMKGMGTIVEWSIRDESSHVNGLTKLFRVFCGEHPHIVNDDFKKRIYEMSRQVYALEERFIELAFKNYKIEGLNKEDVKSYVKFITDRRLIELGLKPNFKQKKNPLDWVDWLINGSDHSNFFEKRVTEYDTHGLTGDWSDAYSAISKLCTLDGNGCA